MSPELQLNKPANELPMEYTSTWIPVTQPPEDAAAVCLSAPLAKENHRIGWWNKEKNGFEDYDGPIYGVTFWTDLPPSPEHMAANPEDFEDIP
jgi:hypothetical protein